MKQILLFTSIIILTIFSSCKDDFEKANEDIKGTWVLESVQYIDSSGLGALVGGLKRVSEKNGKIIIICYLILKY